MLLTQTNVHKINFLNCFKYRASEQFLMNFPFLVFNVQKHRKCIENIVKHYFDSLDYFKYKKLLQNTKSLILWTHKLGSNKVVFIHFKFPQNEWSKGVKSKIKYKVLTKKEELSINVLSIRTVEWMCLQCMDVVIGPHISPSHYHNLKAFLCCIKLV